MSDMNDAVIAEFRANEGRVGGFFKNATLLLLHTTGAKSEEKHVTPLMYTNDGDKMVIIASAGGAQNHPDWYYNVVANSQAGVEAGTEEFQAQATITEEPERTKLYDQVSAVYPNFIEYQEKIDRVIPVITLKRLP